MMAPSGGVRRGGPKGKDAPQRMPGIRLIQAGGRPSDKTQSIYCSLRTSTLVISSMELKVSRISSQSFFQLLGFVSSNFRI